MWQTFLRLWGLKRSLDQAKGKKDENINSLKFGIHPGGLWAESFASQKVAGILDKIRTSKANFGFEFLLHHLLAV